MCMLLTLYNLESMKCAPLCKPHFTDEQMEKQTGLELLKVLTTSEGDKLVSQE